jgi:hypothetical protein
MRDGALAGLLSEYRRRSNGQSPADHRIARNVGFSPNSGASATARLCQLCTKPGHDANKKASKEKAAPSAALQYGTM